MTTDMTQVMDECVWAAVDEKQLEQEMMKKIKRMVGYEPVGMLDLLRLLTHPDLINMTKMYVELKERP